MTTNKARIPQCVDCKSYGERDAEGNVPAAKYSVAIFKAGTTQINKWVFLCEAHMQSTVAQARNAEGKEVPPVYKLSLVIDGKARKGEFYVDHWGGTNVPVGLTYEERNANWGKTDVAEKAKFDKMLSEPEKALHKLHREVAIELDDEFGYVEARINKSTPPEGRVYVTGSETIYGKTDAQMDAFRKRVYDHFQGYEVEFHVESTDDDDYHEIELIFPMIKGATVSDFAAEVRGRMPGYNSLITELENEDDEEE